MPASTGPQRALILFGVALLAPACSGGSQPARRDGGSCSFSLVSNTISPKMATVGVVEWSTSMPNLASARVVFTLNDAGAGVLNRGGSAPVDLSKPNHRTLLLGLKPASRYTFHVQATDVNGATCTSPDYALPATGTLPAPPNPISRTATNPGAQAQGFIVTSSGVTYGNYAVILDADGAVVWYADAPVQCTRARMDYEGVNMWMVAANEDNSTGEMRFVSMDGQTTMTNVGGLANAHHDFAVLPGKIAALVWTTSAIDSESALTEMNADGSGQPTADFLIGSNLYAGGPTPDQRYHCNSVLYHPADDSFTIGDRYPNLYVKVSHGGAIQWQLGGSCAGAPAGPSHCVPETWQVNHGHHLLDDGTILVFNNGTGGAPSHVLELKLSTAGALSATLAKDFTAGDLTSNVLGDVQRLPNGNTLITYSTAGQVLEVDPAWNTVQAIDGIYGYADWRESLYGPPSR